VRDIVRPLSFERLNQYIKQCHDCEICHHAKSLVYGNPNASVLIIKDCVSFDQKDEKYVYPYNPDSDRDEDRILRETLAFYHLNPDELLWINSVQCCPQTIVDGQIIRRTAPNKTEFINCRTFVDFAVQAFAPTFILLMGNIALNAFFDIPIEKVHGKLMSVLGIPTIPVYSPEYLLWMKTALEPAMFEQYKENFYQDMDIVSKYLKEHIDMGRLFLRKE
jgi:uracil-DNA glycosylase